MGSGRNRAAMWFNVERPGTLEIGEHVQPARKSCWGEEKRRRRTEIQEAGERRGKRGEGNGRGLLAGRDAMVGRTDTSVQWVSRRWWSYWRGHNVSRGWAVAAHALWEQLSAEG